jgi:hypothetical protein
MPHEFCTRLTAKISWFGYPPHKAERLAGFLVSSITLVCSDRGTESTRPCIVAKAEKIVGMLTGIIP